MKVSFHADKVKIAGPRVDDSYTVTFEVGEYAYDDISQLPKLNGEVIEVEVKNGETKAEKSE